MRAGVGVGEFVMSEAVAASAPSGLADGLGKVLDELMSTNGGRND
jgi:hypothetical protein